MSKGSQTQWAALRRRVLNGGGPLAAEFRTLEAMTPEERMQYFAPADQLMTRSF
jgi:hypothetical protein